MYSSEGCIKVKVKYTRFQIPVETVKSLCNKVSGFQLPTVQCNYVISTLTCSSSSPWGEFFTHFLFVITACFCGKEFREALCGTG